MAITIVQLSETRVSDLKGLNYLFDLILGCKFDVYFVPDIPPFKFLNRGLNGNILGLQHLVQMVSLLGISNQLALR
jgi:hypothetical protein